MAQCVILSRCTFCLWVCVCVCLCVHLHFISFEWSTSQLPSYLYCSVQFSSVNLRISLDKSGVVYFFFFHLIAPFFASFCNLKHLIFSITSILFFILNTYFIVFRWIVLFHAPDASVLKSFVQQNMTLVFLHSNIFRSFFIWFVLSLVSMPLFKPKFLFEFLHFVLVSLFIALPSPKVIDNSPSRHHNLMYDESKSTSNGEVSMANVYLHLIFFSPDISTEKLLI